MTEPTRKPDATSDEAGVWRPSQAQRAAANWTRFLSSVGLPDYPALEAKAQAEPDWFWERLIDFLDIRFETPFSAVRDISDGAAHARWCVGATMNMTATLLDRHLATGRGAHDAIVFESETGEARRLTYAQLAREVGALSRGLLAQGVKPGEVVGVFLPLRPEAVIAFLAIIRIGAITLPLFSGFGEEAIVARLTDADAVAVIAMESTRRRGKTIAMKATLDAALERAPTVRRVIVAPSERSASMKAGRDIWWDEAATQGDVLAPAIVEAEQPMMVIYTSGTTGKPKGTIHTHCGFLIKTGEDMILAFDLKPTDRLLWMTDLGWLVGPVQIVATLLAGATLILAEGGPDYPDAGRLWRLADDHRVTLLGLSPTAARIMKSHGADEARRYDMPALRAMPSTGEPWDHASWMWVMENVLRGRGPLMNYVGGTEMGGILATNVLYPIKPISFYGPIPGTGAEIFDERGGPVAAGEVGELVMRSPCIGTTRGLWRDEARYLDNYWSRYPGVWHHGDWAMRDEDGYWFVRGRSDDTIKIAGKRTGPAEIEALLLATGAVVDAAVVGVPDPIKGAAIICAVIPSPDRTPGAEIADALSGAVAAGLGGAFRPSRILFVSDLPRTRNLKIMRRVIRAVLTDQPPGDLAALVNPESVEELRAVVAKA